MKNLQHALLAIGLAFAPSLVHAFPALLDALADKAHVVAALRALPYFCLFLTVALGWKLNQRRVVAAAIVYAGAYWLSINRVIWDDSFISPTHVHLALSIGVPLSLLAVTSLPDGRWLSWRGVLFVLAAVVPTPLLIAGLAQKVPNLWDVLTYHPATMPRQTLAPLGVTAGVLICLPLWWRRQEDLRTYGWYLALGLVPLFDLIGRRDGAGTLVDAPLAFSATGLLALYGLLRLYWSRIYLDELTQVANRRAFEEAIRDLRSNYGIAIVDIDHFKKFNDLYGHAAGDQVLKMVAGHLRRCPGARVFRYGGEEFCLLFEQVNPEDAEYSLEELCATLAERVFVLRRPDVERNQTSARDRGKASVSDGKKVRVSISIGFATWMPTDHDVRAVLEAADKALYRAKRGGRNRVVIR